MGIARRTLIEKYTLIDRHGFTLHLRAGRTSDDGLEKDCGHKVALSINLVASEVVNPFRDSVGKSRREPGN